MKKVALCLLILISAFAFLCNTRTVYAESLEEEINSQLNDIDFSELNDFYDKLECIPDDYNFFENISEILSGKIDADYSSVFKYIFSVFFDEIYSFLPVVIGIIAVSLFTGIISKIKSAYISEGLNDVLSFVCVLSVLLLISSQFISVYKKTEKVISLISDFSQVISPILLTLMVASGGSVSATVYKPVVSVLSGSIIGIVYSFVLPLVCVMTVLSLISFFSDSVKLNKFTETIASVIKWVIGISVTVFGVFLSVQGIVSSVHDGISLRATKYAISNSVPIIGGFLRDGLDLVIGGSVLIKNAVGISSVFVLFYIVLLPVLNVIAFSLLLKLCAGFSECFDNIKVANLCSSISKSLSYFITCILMVGFLFFITLLLMIFSANSFV